VEGIVELRRGDWNGVSSHESATMWHWSININNLHGSRQLGGGTRRLVATQHTANKDEVSPPVRKQG